MHSLASRAPISWAQLRPVALSARGGRSACAPCSRAFLLLALAITFLPSGGTKILAGALRMAVSGHKQRYRPRPGLAGSTPHSRSKNRWCSRLLSAISDHSPGGRCRTDSRPISVRSGGTTRWHGNRRSGFKSTLSAQLICPAIPASRLRPRKCHTKLPNQAPFATFRARRWHAQPSLARRLFRQCHRSTLQ